MTQFADRYGNYLDIFLVSPGGGREYTYSPVGVNATLECTVSSNGQRLSWIVDNFHFEIYSTLLNERGIYQLQSEQIASSKGLSSVLLVIGNITENDTKVCCEALVRRSLAYICTTLIIYGKEQNVITCFYHEFQLENSVVAK